MEYINNYITKNNIIPIIPDKPSANTGLIVVIPCYNEFFIDATLHSLLNCDKPHSDVEVIIVINDSERSPFEAKIQNRQTLERTIIWAKRYNTLNLKFYPVYCPDLPHKHAGVGLARKIGMDQAVLRFNAINNENGIIINFDADSVCDKNYFTEIENHFAQNTKSPGASIYFEHPIISTEELTFKSSGIIQYELHLRYMNQALRHIGHPHAFHTVGSSCAVKLGAYVKQGGMNKRQAGEDFYFIQKIIWLGNYSEINSTRIIPSPRVSDRVPFGTGAALKKFTENNENILLTYNIDAYLDLKQFFNQLHIIYNLPGTEIFKVIDSLNKPLKKYLKEINADSEIQSVKNNTAEFNSFRNRFFLWFNAFKVIKYLNQSHINYFVKKPIASESIILLNIMNIAFNPVDTSDLLNVYRLLDKGDFNYR